MDYEKQGIGALEYLVEGVREAIDKDFVGFDHDGFRQAVAGLRRVIDDMEKAVAGKIPLPNPILLVVDDDCTARTAVARLARSVGFDVVNCRGVADVRAYYARLGVVPRVIVTDWNLLDGDGADVFGEVTRKGQHTKTRVVVHSGERANLYKLDVPGILKGDTDKLESMLRDLVVS